MNAIAIPDVHDPILTIDVKDLFDPENTALNEALAQLRASVTSEVFDVTEEQGRKQIARLAHKVARTKTAIDGAGKEYVSGLKNQAKKIDAIRKQTREYLDDVKAEVRAPLTEWEEQEKARQEEIERMIQEMHILGNVMTIDHTGLAPLDSKQLKANIAMLERMEVDIRYGERMTEAKLVKADILGKLQVQVAAMAALEEQQRQEEQARIEAERLAREEREREIAERARQRERAEAQRREAEQKKIAERARQRELAAAQRREAEQKEIAERQLIAAQQREEMAKQRAERERIAKQRAERDSAAAKEREARMKADAEKAARIAAEEKAKFERENEERKHREDAMRKEREAEEAKRQEELKASYDRRRIEAADSLQSILDVGDPYISGSRILKQIIEGNVPHVRFTD